MILSSPSAPMARYHPRAVTDYSTTEAARRAGVDEAFVDRLIELGVIEARPNHRLTAADVRRVQLTRITGAIGRCGGIGRHSI
jgi:hypothetical protein